LAFPCEFFHRLRMLDIDPSFGKGKELGYRTPVPFGHNRSIPFA
jgi:hypothetical protein